MPAFVRETASGWEVVDGARVTAFDSARAACDAALRSYTLAEKDAVLRDERTGDPNGEWRWIHASAVEDSAKGGTRIDAVTLDEAIASLNSSSRPRAIDGGTLDSEVHGTELTAGATLANGWAHAAVRSEDPSGRLGCFVRAEVLPALAPALDTGRMAYASIAVRGTSKDETGAIRGARFSSLALTNQPANDDLTPTSAIRTDTGPEVRGAFAVRSLRQEPPMSKLSLRAKLGPKHLALRGPAIDKVVEVARSLGVDPEAEFEAEEWESPTKAAFCAIRMAAQAEKILEGIPAATPPAEAAAARSAINAAVRSALGLRAEVADDILAAMQALMSKLGLAADATAEAINAAASKLPEAEMASEKKTEQTAARSDSEIEKAVLDRLAKLEAEHERVAMRAHVEREFAKAKAALPGDADVLVGELLSVRSEPVRARLLSLSIKSAVGAPPVTREIAPTASGNVEATSASDEKAAAIRTEEARIRKEQPDLAPHKAMRAAMTAARQKNPALFGGEN